MDFAMIGAFLRQLLTFGAGVAVAKGYVDNGTAEQAIGAVAVLASTGWSLWQKKAAQKQIAKAEAAPPKPPGVEPTKLTP